MSKPSVTPIARFVFLDTQAYEAASFNTESAHFKTLARHLKSGRLKLLITDITKTEVHHRIDKQCHQELASLKDFRQKARLLRTANGITDLGLFSAADLDGVPQLVRRAIDTFLDDHDTTVIDATAQDAGSVFQQYFSEAPPFGPGAKRKEFPDAFVVEALTDWADQQAEMLFVVSGDERFRCACQKSDRLNPVEDISALLDDVASDDETLATFLREQLAGALDQIMSIGKQEFEELGFYVENKWSGADLEVMQIDLSGEPELIDVSGTETTAELKFDVKCQATLSYPDPNAGTYDSGLRGLFLMEHVDETVGGSMQMTVTVKATFEGTDAGRFRIQNIELTEPSAGFGIPTSKMADSPWK